MAARRACHNSAADCTGAMLGSPETDSKPPQLPSRPPICRGRMQAPRGRHGASPPHPRLPVGAGRWRPCARLEAQNHRESMRLMNSHNIARVTPDPAPPSPRQSDSSPKAPAPDWRATWAGSRENRDCTVRRRLLMGFFTFDVIVVNRSGCVRWGCQTWARGGGKGGSGARQCPS